jgi:site-specific recombinase XerD
VKRLKRETIDGWPGYVHRQRNGKPVFIIEKMVGGRRFHVSTRANTVTAATEQLARFQANPEAYSPGGNDGRPVRMTAALVLEFRRWQREQKRVSVKHARDVQKYLADWMEDIGNRDVRALRAAELREMVGRRTAQAHRIAALKVFVGWLRLERGLVRHHQDATLDLRVPQSTPEKHRRRKVLDFAAVEAIISYLGDDARACVTLLCATGWHRTELDRFARAGELQPRELGVMVAVTPHKSGDIDRKGLSGEALAAAKHLRERGCVPQRLWRELHAASAAAGLPREKWVTPGVFRHSVATWAVEDGASIEQVSKFLGHKDPRTTRRFYVDMREPVAAVPTRLPHLAPRKSSRTKRASSTASGTRS